MDIKGIRKSSIFKEFSSSKSQVIAFFSKAATRRNYSFDSNGESLGKANLIVKLGSHVTVTIPLVPAIVSAALPETCP